MVCSNLSIFRWGEASLQQVTLLVKSWLQDDSHENRGDNERTDDVAPNNIPEGIDRASYTQNSTKSERV